MSECGMKLRSRTIKPKRVFSSATTTRQKAFRKTAKEQAKDKRCVCIPQDYSPVQFPLIWTEFRKDSRLCDGVITCEDGVRLKIHRAILSAVSSYFRAHFTNILNDGVPENVEAKVSVPSYIFSKILDFAYTGFCNIDHKNVEQLLKAADQYHVLGVIQLCCKYILDELRPSNCLGILKFARHYFCHDLEKKGKRFVLQNFMQLLNENSEFAKLSINEVLEILQDDELNVSSEEIVFEALLRWVEVNTDARKVHLLSLLKCVRLGNVSEDFLIDPIQTCYLVAENKECTDYISNVLTLSDKLVSNQIESNNVLARPRVPYDILFAVGGWSAGSPTNFIETYDVRANRWLLSMDTDTVPRAYHGLCALNGCIYMIGGFDGNEHFNTVRCFDPAIHQWKECACMYYPRCYVSVAMHRNKIYAMGGYNGRIRMSSAERYDPNKNQWELIKPMLKQRSDASAAVLQDKIYIVGGFNGHEVMNSAEVYDTLNNQWTLIPPMTTARSGVSLVAFKNTLYALGGFNGFTRLTTCEKFSPGVSSNWKDVRPMFSPRSNFATVILDDIIFVIGGFNGSSTINYVECYNPKTRQWFEASPMNLNRSALSACIISGLLNAKDYSLMGKNSEEVGQGAGPHEVICNS